MTNDEIDEKENIERRTSNSERRTNGSYDGLTDGADVFRVASSVPSVSSAVQPSAGSRSRTRRDYEIFFFASSGTSTLVVPTSLISTVVVRSTSRSSPLKVTVP